MGKGILKLEDIKDLPNTDGPQGFSWPQKASMAGRPYIDTLMGFHWQITNSSFLVDDPNIAYVSKTSKDPEGILELKHHKDECGSLIKPRISCVEEWFKCFLKV